MTEEIKELEDKVLVLSAEVDEYDRLIQRQHDLLTDTVNVLKGPPPELTTWSHHDVAELARESVQRSVDMGNRAMRTSHIILLGASMQGCNWDTTGTTESLQGIYVETLRLVREKTWDEAVRWERFSERAGDANPYREQ